MDGRIVLPTALDRNGEHVTGPIEFRAARAAGSR
jgi:hypothetical protein